MPPPVGPIAQALVTAALQGPAPVRELAYRSQVGSRAAWYTATRLVQRGELVVVDAGRPAVLGLPEHSAAWPCPVAQAVATAPRRLPGHDTPEDLARLFQE